MRQKRRNDTVDPDRCQAAGVVVTFPRQPQIRHVRLRLLAEECSETSAPLARREWA